MAHGTTACCTRVAILVVETFKGDKRPALSKGRDIDLSWKHSHLLVSYCPTHLACGMTTCHGVVESNENTDVALSKCEDNTANGSAEYCHVYETSLSHAGRHQDCGGIIDFVCFWNQLIFENPSIGHQILQKMVLIRKKRRAICKKKKRKRSMKTKSHLHYKTGHHNLIRERTLKPYCRRHPKNCALKQYRMLKLRIFLVLLNCKAGVETSNTVNCNNPIDEEDAEAAAKELCLNFRFETKKISQFYHCGINSCNGQIDTLLYSRNDQAKADDGGTTKSPLFGNFEVLRDKLAVFDAVWCDLFGYNPLCNGDSLLENVPGNFSGDSPINICRNDGLSEAGCVVVVKNSKTGDMSASRSADATLDSSSAGIVVKSIRNNHYYDLFENSLQSVKKSEVISEDKSFKMSKLFHNKKLNLSNAHNAKTTDTVDWRFKTPGMDSFKSYMDISRLLGIYPRYSHSLPMFWQEITLYPFTHVNTNQSDLHQLMRYEVFRLCSFSYARFPADFDVWVTRLAQAGFYCESQNGRIICFHCGCEFRGAVGSSIEDVHNPDCQRQEHSRPLHVWTEGLNQEVLTVYYSRYGSLRPYNFELSSQQSLSDEAYSGHENLQESAVTEPQAQNYSQLTSRGTSGDEEASIPELPGVTREDSVSVSARPEYHSETLPADFTDTNRDHGVGDQLRSLPGNLNEVSGAIVSEESQETPQSYQVLTSAARNPMSFYNPAARAGLSQTEDGNENGAVGGAGVTLDLSKASYPLFSSAEARRQSFITWSQTHSHRPEDLVAAGFFYAGYADCVRCFYCGLGLKYWRPTDIPAYQHARYRPHCVYNRLYKGQDYIDRVQQDLQTEQGTADQPFEAAPPARSEVMTAVVQRPNRVVDEVASATGTPSVTAPSVPDTMNSEVVQEAMRNGWDRNQVQRAVDHIVREFGVHSLEISLLLDVLTNLNMDNPERNLPSGGSVGSTDSGLNDPDVLPGTAAEEIVHDVNVGHGIDVADSHEADRSSQARAVPIQQPAVPPIEFNELFMSVEREHTLLAERTTCRLCRRRPVSCIFLPCGHVIACQDCADNATHCILCSKQIIGTANIYLA